MAELKTWDARTMTDDQRRTIATLLCEVWPKPGRTVQTRVAQMKGWADAYAGPDATAPRSFVIFDGEQLVAHAAILGRTIATESGPLTVAGLAQVCTAPATRGRGLGMRITRAALTPVDASEFPVALFQTSEQVQPFYLRIGARRVNNRFVNSLAEDPEANPWNDPVQMIYPAAAPWPDGTIDLCGPGY